jgi:hypothetical protein
MKAVLPVLFQRAKSGYMFLTSLQSPLFISEQMTTNIALNGNPVGAADLLSA